MNVNDLKKILKKKDREVKIEKDDPTTYRVFIYKKQKKISLISQIEKIKTLQIVMISDYPKQEGLHYPVCVIRLNRVRIMKKYKERVKNNKEKQE